LLPLHIFATLYMEIKGPPAYILTIHIGADYLIQFYLFAN
jgi:hypothetical protein